MKQKINRGSKRMAVSKEQMGANIKEVAHVRSLDKLKILKDFTILMAFRVWRNTYSSFLINEMVGGLLPGSAVVKKLKRLFTSRVSISWFDISVSF